MGGAACGDGEGDVATPTSASQPVAATAAELAPNLSASGFTVAQSGKVPGSTQNQDTYFAIYTQATGGKVSTVRVEINLHPTAAAATAQYTPLAEALRNPPPDLFGTAAAQQDGTVVYQADQSKSYKTTKPDGGGNLVFSDIHRAGRAIAIVYAIGPDTPDTANLRKQVAEAIAARAPR